MTNKLRKNHKFLSASGHLKQICQPLSIFKIHMFTYLKKIKSGGQINLSTNPKWIADYYNLSLFDTSDYEKHPAKQFTGFNLWPEENKSAVFQHGREYFDSKYGFTICQEQQDSYEFFFFSLTPENYSMLNACINNLDLFEQFIFYFKEKAAPLLKECLSSPIILEQSNSIEINTLEIETLKNKFKREISGNQFARWLNQHERLTPREKECLQTLLQYPNTKDLASVMQISKRTAETHLERLKQKLDCESKQELLIKLNSFSQDLIFIKK